ncbi:hypothetical protein [Corallococcus sp. M7]
MMETEMCTPFSSTRSTPENRSSASSGSSGADIPSGSRRQASAVQVSPVSSGGGRSFGSRIQASVGQTSSPSSSRSRASRSSAEDRARSSGPLAWRSSTSSTATPAVASATWVATAVATSRSEASPLPSSSTCRTADSATSATSSVARMRSMSRSGPFCPSNSSSTAVFAAVSAASDASASVRARSTLRSWGRAPRTSSASTWGRDGRGPAAGPGTDGSRRGETSSPAGCWSDACSTSRASCSCFVLPRPLVRASNMWTLAAGVLGVAAAFFASAALPPLGAFAWAPDFDAPPFALFALPADFAPFADFDAADFFAAFGLAASSFTSPVRGAAPRWKGSFPRTPLVMTGSF